MSALGQKQTPALQKGMSALPLIATAKADMPQNVMSALPLKADMCSALTDVRFGPKADIPYGTFLLNPKAHLIDSSRVFAVAPLLPASVTFR
jgi:hypothetical protein